MFRCHGCGTLSRKSKTAKFPPRWMKRTEGLYSERTGNPRRGYVENYYCPVCVSWGCTAKTVAATTKKLARKQSKAK
jgi:hypothetical protein